MVDLLTFLEGNALSVFIREFPSVFGFPTILFLHTLGLAMVAGVSIGIDCWILRAPATRGLPHLVGLARTMWLGFGINLLSGIGLLLAYPAKALTNWVFYFKMALVVLAVYIASRIHRELTLGSTLAGQSVAFAVRRWAIASLLTWAGAIVTGRLLAYTYVVLFSYEL